MAATHKLAFSVTVSYPDGTEHSYQAHRYNCDDQALQWFIDKLGGFGKSMQKAFSNGSDGANLSAVAEMTIDGVPVPSVSGSGVSYPELVRLEREFHHIGDELLRIAEGHVAKGKK